MEPIDSIVRSRRAWLFVTHAKAEKPPDFGGTWTECDRSRPLTPEGVQQCKKGITFEGFDPRRDAVMSLTSPAIRCLSTAVLLHGADGQIVPFETLYLTPALTTLRQRIGRVPLSQCDDPGTMVLSAHTLGFFQSLRTRSYLLRGSRETTLAIHGHGMPILHMAHVVAASYGILASRIGSREPDYCLGILIAKDHPSIPDGIHFAHA